jgi:hypothetical protein
MLGVVVPRPAMARYFDPEICTGGNTLFDELDRYYCDGYLLKSDCSRLLNPTAMVPSSDDENEWRAACEQGRERGSSDDRQKQLRQNMEQQEQQRRALLAQPAFEPGANPLLGRWQREQAAQQQQDVFAQAVALASDIMCTTLSGGGQFEFRDSTLAREDGTVEPMQYRRGGRGVVYAMGEDPLRLLEFQFDGRDRITWATCAFNRMGAAAVSVPSPTTRTPQQLTTTRPTAMEAEKPGPPRLPPPGGGAQLILDTCDAQGAGAKNCFDLGHPYANGFGVEQNMPLSMELFQKACKLGHQTACKRAYGE